MLAENDAARQRSRPAPNLLLDWNAWRDRLIAGHKTNGTGQALDSDDVEAITTYLHGAGQIFRLQHGGETAILVDQEWATSLIYEMLRPGGRLYELIIANGGWLALDDLHEERDWKLLASDLQRERLLAYLEESHVLVRVPTDHAGGPEKTLFVANEKWLLPKDEAIAGRLEAVMQQVRARPAMDSWERFSFEAAKLNEFAFRDLMACLGRRFGANATWFRSGLQVAPNDQQPDRCLRVRWVPDGPDAFLGTVEAVLVTPHRDLSRDRDWLEKLFTDEKSPLAGHGQPVRHRADATDLTHEFICPLQPGQADVGISSSGEDHATAEALRTALRQAGIKVLWYKLPECRADEYEKLKPFMEKLGRSPCIVLLLSDTYLRDDPANNWYCLYELADAINRLADGRRSAARTLVLYQPGGNVSSQNLDVTIAPLFPKFAQCFADAYDRVPVEQWANFQRFNDLSLHFSTAYQTGSVARLFRERGTDGTFSSVAIKPDGTPDFTQLLADVRKALHGP